ncbi:MAG: hypothetical protein Q8P73_04960 [bacterium]|nr:hypothetical protein [bacterium]MDZ4343105.1 hypothetical protein [Candidatus Binatia bacterium]
MSGNNFRVEIERGGVLLWVNQDDRYEADGIFNPAVAGDYLLYRAAGSGNYSRIMAARLSYDKRRGDVNADRLQRIILEPMTAYEKMSEENGGVEDPRVTRLADGKYVMLYVGYGYQKETDAQESMIAAAISENGLIWERLGRIMFEPLHWQGHMIDLNRVPNKDAVLFSEKIGGRYALYHRPMFSAEKAKVTGVPRRAIWYAEAEQLTGPWSNHRMVAIPKYDWEISGIGSGVPPIRMGNTWLNIYHGFIYQRKHKHYCAGAFVTSADKPYQITWRQAEPVLEPIVYDEKKHRSKHIVFPTAVWSGAGERPVIIWGCEDSSIMWGWLNLRSAQAGPSASLRLPA